MLCHVVKSPQAKLNAMTNQLNQQLYNRDKQDYMTGLLNNAMYQLHCLVATLNVNAESKLSMYGRLVVGGVGWGCGVGVGVQQESSQLTWRGSAASTANRWLDAFSISTVQCVPSVRVTG